MIIYKSNTCSGLKLNKARLWNTIKKYLPLTVYKMHVIKQGEVLCVGPALPLSSFSMMNTSMERWTVKLHENGSFLIGFDLLAYCPVRVVLNVWR